MKTLQKDTNLLTEKLERSFTVTDDTIFRVSKFCINISKFILSIFFSAWKVLAFREEHFEKFRGMVQ